MPRRNSSALWAKISLIGLASISFASVAGATVWGVKSQFGTGGSTLPAHLFRFEPGDSNVTDLGSVTLLGGQQIDVDALAISAQDGLLAFRWFQSTGDSQLVSVDPMTAIATPIGALIVDREIRGAAFIAADLYVVDSANDVLLNIDPATGSQIGPDIPLSVAGQPLDVSTIVDIAIASNGAVYLVSSARFYSLDISSGALVEVFDDPNDGDGCPHLVQVSNNGATFTDGAPAGDLFTQDANCGEDVFIYAVDNAFGRTPVFEDILPGFNAGRGDLAAIVSPVAVPSAGFAARVLLCLGILLISLVRRIGLSKPLDRSDHADIF